jgi:hypothetical protein
MSLDTGSARERFSYRLACLAPATVCVAVVLWAASLDNDDYCGTVGECLGLSFNDLLALIVAVPFAALMLRLLKVPRVLLHTATTLVLGGLLWFTADQLLRALDPGRPYDAQLPLALAVAVGALTGVASTYLVGPGGRRPVRLVIPVLALAVALGSSFASAQATRAHRVDRIAAAPVTLYAPVIDGHGPDYAYGSEESVRLSYSFENATGRVFMSVTLVPAPEGSFCDAERIIVGPDCRQEGDVIQDFDSSGYGTVGLVRGDTALVAAFTPDDLEPDDVLDALRTAPVRSPADLA